jgi:hypothetical protein
MYSMKKYKWLLHIDYGRQSFVPVTKTWENQFIRREDWLCFMVVEVSVHTYIYKKRSVWSFTQVNSGFWSLSSKEPVVWMLVFRVALSLVHWVLIELKISFSTAERCTCVEWAGLWACFSRDRWWEVVSIQAALSRHASGWRCMSSTSGSVNEATERPRSAMGAVSRESYFCLLNIQVCSSESIYIKLEFSLPLIHDMVETGHTGGFGLSAATPQCSSDFVPHLSYPLITGLFGVHTFFNFEGHTVYWGWQCVGEVGRKYGGVWGKICRLPRFGGWYTWVTDH